jgi:threonine dehydratase
MYMNPDKVAARVAPERIEAASRSIDSVFLETPQFLSEPLSDQFGVRLILKVETVNPIRSFKGRGADHFVSGLNSDSPPLVCASAGNFGQAIAYSARKRGLRAIIYAAESANPFKVERMRKLGAEVRLAGVDFDAAKERALAFAQESGGSFVEDGREPAISEGAGTIAIELCRWPGAIDCIVAPLGNGALLAGIGAWMKSKSPATRIIGVCAAGAPSMALSWRTGKLQPTESVATIADGIAVRVPVPEALADLERVLDDVLVVEDAALIETMRLVFQHHGLVTEPAGVAGLGAILSYGDRFRGATIATPLCGGNISPEHTRSWLLPNV